MKLPKSLAQYLGYEPAKEEPIPKPAPKPQRPKGQPHARVKDMTIQQIRSLHAASGDGTSPSPPRGWRSGDRPVSRPDKSVDLDTLHSEFWPKIADLQAHASHVLVCESCGMSRSYRGAVMPAGWTKDRCPFCAPDHEQPKPFIERRLLSDE